MAGPSNPLPRIGGEVRVSLPTGTQSPVNITFERLAENEAALKQRAESIGEAASRAFDDFIKKKTAQVRPGNPNDNDEEVIDDGDLREQLLTATQRWLGEAREVYNREIVPRLQYGGGLTLPEPGRQQQCRALGSAVSRRAADDRRHHENDSVVVRPSRRQLRR